MAATYRSIAGLIGWSVLILQYWLMAAGQPVATLAERTINYFSYFTILSNILVALALSAPALARWSGSARWWLQPVVRAGIAVYIAVVMAIYHLLLREIWDPQGWQLVADVSLHYVMPILYLIDWLAFAPKVRLAWRVVVWWLAFPLLYGVWSLIHGAMTGWYPYPFLDAGVLGYPSTLGNMAAMVLVFLVPGLGVVALDRLLARRTAPAAA